MTPTRQLLEAAIEGFTIQKAQIDAKINEIRDALMSPVEVMQSGIDKISKYNLEHAVPWPLDKSYALKPKKRKMSAEGRANISAATKKRWAKYRKEKRK